MSDVDKSHWLLSETSGIEETRSERWQRHLPPWAGLEWLKAGWHDLMRKPAQSLAYGVVVFVVSTIFIWVLAYFGRDYILFPALAGFLIVGPVIAIGLYEKSRALEVDETVTLRRMLFVRARGGAQVYFSGLLLCLLMLLWMRAAVIVYALFFGIRPFPGLDHIVAVADCRTAGLGNAGRRQRDRRAVCSVRVCHQRILHPDAAGQANRCIDCHGHQYGAGLEQSHADDSLGCTGARTVRGQCRDRVGRPDRDIPVAGSCDLARLSDRSAIRGGFSAQRRASHLTDGSVRVAVPTSCPNIPMVPVYVHGSVSPQFEMLLHMRHGTSDTCRHSARELSLANARWMLCVQLSRHPRAATPREFPLFCAAG